MGLVLRTCTLLTRKHAVLVNVALLATLAATCASATTKNDKKLPAFRDGLVLVAFQESTALEQQAKVIAEAGAVELRVIGKGVHVLRVAPGRVAQAIEVLQHSAEVRYAEPDFRHSLNGAPNDPKFPQQWALQNTGQTVNGVAGLSGADEGALRAWAVTTGTNSVVVAIVDSGIDYKHPDLAANVWSNPGGINGCAASTHGYNVLTNACDPMDDDTVYNGHGTHVAGIIGAVANNATGVAGLNWQTSLMGVKWVDANGNGYTSDLISALDWVIRAKEAGVNVRVVNDSQTWAGTAASRALAEEIDALGAHDILFVTAAGNTGQNNDTTPRYPCVYDRPNQICVAASNQRDQLWSSSNYGAQTVDMAAPGVNILSTLRNGAYGFISGCSMSAAQVSGAAALVLSVGDQPVANLQATLLNSIDPLPAFTSTTRSGGRLDICKAIAGCIAGVPVNTSSPTISGTTAAGQRLSTTNGSWSGNPTNFAYQWQRCDAAGTNCAVISGATSNNYTVTSSDVGSTVRSVVTAANSAGSASATSAPTSIVQSNSSGFALVQKAAAQGSGVASLSVSFPGNNIKGNLIIAAVRASTTTQSMTVTDSLGNSYREAVHQAQTTDGHQVHIFYAANITAGANTVTASFSAGNTHPWLAVYEYSGLSTTAPLDRTASAQGTGTAVSSGTTAQTRTANELVFSLLGLPSSSSAIVTAGTGYTPEQQSATSGGSRAATEDEVVTFMGTFAATYTLSSGSNWSTGVATFAATPITSATPLAISTTSVPSGTVGSAYSTALGATGGSPPYTWAQSGSLPPGLALSSNGTIAGTPTAAGTWNFFAEVTDASSATATQALSITISSSTTGTISLAQSASARGSAVSSISQSFPSANTPGNLVIAFVRLSSTSQTVKVTDTAGNAYADAIAQGQSVDGHQIHIFFAKNIKSGANTVTATFSAANNHPWLAVYEFGGLSVTSPLGQVAAAQGSSSTPNSGLTALTSAAPELVFAGVGLPSSSTVTVSAGSGFTLLQQDAVANGSRAATEYKVVSATGQYAGTFALSGIANWSAVVATFHP